MNENKSVLRVTKKEYGQEYKNHLLAQYQLYVEGSEKISDRRQNANNYFENLLGETANIRRVNIGFAHFLVLRAHTPYYDKNKGNLRGKEKKIEILNENDLSKYIKLFKDLDFPHKPEVLGIAIIDFDKRGRAYFEDLKNLGLTEETKNALENQLSLGQFIEKVIALCKLKS